MVNIELGQIIEEETQFEKDQDKLNFQQEENVGSPQIVPGLDFDLLLQENCKEFESSSENGNQENIQVNESYLKALFSARIYE